VSSSGKKLTSRLPYDYQINVATILNAHFNLRLCPILNFLKKNLERVSEKNQALNLIAKGNKGLLTNYTVGGTWRGLTDTCVFWISTWAPFLWSSRGRIIG
jgi:hypothetical protein